MERKKILIVEDEAALLYALKARLTVDGYEVLTADSAELGLKIIEQAKPNVIVLDILLPEMNGYDFLKKIKNDERFREIPVIITSNLSAKKEIEKGLKLGAKDYLVKTEFNLDDFIKKITLLVNHAHK